MPDDPGVYRLLQFLPPPKTPRRPHTNGGLHPMQGRLTKLRILFHCLLDGGQFSVARSCEKSNAPIIESFSFVTTIYFNYCVVIGFWDTELSAKSIMNIIIWIGWHKFKIIIFILKNPSSTFIDTSDNTVIK